MIRNIFNSLSYFKKINNNVWYSLSIPLLILAVLSMLVLPLPPFFLDLLFTFNIVISIIILIVSMFTTDTLDFSVFPTILLFSTLLRLSLNIASTRMILLNGHIGSFSVGHVIESFGFFLIKGNFFVGLIIFIILIIMNFLVITKGSSRIAEVGARFILDAMPGKQMAIDADLNAGIISEKEAKKRRISVHGEADFYGAMDGASKFIRGDAIAGIIIMIVNLLGGLVIGIVQHNMSFLEAAKVYSALTIGDGLVAQIPSLIISIASGIILTRVGSEKINIGTQIVNQVFNNSEVIFLSAVIFFVFGLIPGMPNFIFLFCAFILLVSSWYLYYKNIKNKKIFKRSRLGQLKVSNLSWNDVQFESLLTLELSSVFLKPIYSDTYNYLLQHLYILRKNIVQDFGFLVPEIDICHNHKLKEGQYKILIKGVESGLGHVFLDKLLALNYGKIVFEIPGIQVKEPIFVFPAFWIDPQIKERVIRKNIVIKNPNFMIITQLNNILRTRLYELLGFQETQQLLSRVSQKYPKLVDYLIPKMISITTLQNILKNLLKDNLSIKDMGTILETLIKYSDKFNNNIEKLTDCTRIALKNFITQKFFLNNKYINAIGLSQEIENILLKVISNKNSQLEPIFSEKLIKRAKLAIQLQKKANFPIVLLVKPQLRLILSKLFDTSVAELTVLSLLEISEDKVIKIVNII